MALSLKGNAMSDPTAVPGVPIKFTRPKRNHRPPRHPLRLSWPKANDSRRAVVGTSPPENVADRTGRPTLETQFVHISLSDIEMHHHLTVSGTTDITTPPALSIPLPWNPQKLQVGDKDLLDYFRHAAVRALATFGQDPTDLGNIVLRMALSSDTHSATAVLRSLLAFSSLHRHGMQSQALELKVSALAELSASESTNLDTVKLVHHVVACMLLYSFEVQQSSSTSGDWVRYICGVEKLLRLSHPTLPQGSEEDIAALLDWVYYNDIVGRFSLQHWDNNGKGVRLLLVAPTVLSESSRAAPSAVKILGFFSEAYNLAGPEDTESYEAAAGQGEYVKILDWRIRSVSTTSPMQRAFQLAVLVYLGRISGSSAHPTRTQQHIDEAFLLLSKLEYCERQLPLFILGCEARSDDQRTIILDLISKSEGNIASRSYSHLKLLLEAIWAQDDLVDRQSGNLEYRNKLTSTMSRCPFPPCLA